MLHFAMKNKTKLSNYSLVGTKTTGTLIQKEIGLKVKCFLSGPNGGDAQIASLVAEGNVHAVIFLIDPLNAHPHDPDIHTLLRVCNVHNIPLATNAATAQLVLTSL